MSKKRTPWFSAMDPYEVRWDNLSGGLSRHVDRLIFDGEWRYPSGMPSAFCDFHIRDCRDCWRGLAADPKARAKA